MMKPMSFLSPTGLGTSISGDVVRKNVDSHPVSTKNASTYEISPNRTGDKAGALVPVSSTAIARSERTSLAVISHLDKVPLQHKAWIVKIAKNSHELKRPDLTLTAFTELMAQCWLDKCDEFDRLAQEHGFQSVKRMPRFIDAAALVLTKSGSFVAMTRPNYLGIRKIKYVRIGLREDMAVPIHRSYLYYDLALSPDQTFVKTRLIINTSSVIGIYLSPDADDKKVDEATGDIAQTLGGVEEHTRLRGMNDEKS